MMRTVVLPDKDWSKAHHLIRKMRENPQVNGFFTIIRQLEAQNHDMPRLGTASRPAQSPIRFGQNISLAYESSEIESVIEDRGGRAPRVLVNFIGLLGPQGPMPLDMTEYVRDREHNVGDATLARFLDVYHHRFIELFYRAWSLNEQVCSFDRQTNDWFSDLVASISGYGLPQLRNRDTVQDYDKMYFSGRLAGPVRNAEGLRVILSTYTGVEVSVDEFQAHWIKLPKIECTRLGESPRTCTLGQGMVVGRRVWDVQSRFKVNFGPLDLKNFESLLPESEQYQQVVEWVRNFSGDSLEYIFELILKSEEIPETRLGQYGQLGRTSWLGACAEQHQDGRVRLNPQAITWKEDEE